MRITSMPATSRTGTPKADPTAEQLEVFYIDSKTADNETDVQFKLSSPVDVTGQKVPARQMTSRCAVPAGASIGVRTAVTPARSISTSSATRLITLQMMSAPERSQAASCAGEDEQLPFGGFPAIAITRI